MLSSICPGKGVDFKVYAKSDETRFVGSKDCIYIQHERQVSIAYLSPCPISNFVNTNILYHLYYVLESMSLSPRLMSSCQILCMTILLC